MAFLKELVTIEKGKKVTPSEEVTGKSIRYIQIGDLRTNKNYQYCEVDASYKIANQDDIIIAWDGANAGQSSYGLEGAIGSTLALLKRKSDDYYTPFLGKYINSKFDYFQKNSTGATIPHLSRVSLDNLLIPLPPLDIQKKIADTLDKAQELINKRKEQISALDKFLENLFLDMFGDPVSNPMGWEIKELKGIIEKLEAGKSLAGEIEIDNKVLNTGCISKKFFNKFDYKYLPEEYVPNENHLVSAGDLLISRMNTEELVGVCGYVFDVLENTYIPDRLWKVVLKDKKIPLIFLWFAFKNKSFKTKISNISTGTSGSMKNISKEKFLGLKCILPPLDLQNQFASIVEKVEAEKTKLEASLKEMEDNFNSIMQRAFKGELY